MQTTAPRVLVVDKDAQVQRLLERILSDAGYAADFVQDGYAALDDARRHPPAIVVTEIMVPRLDGLALCRLLKADPATSGTKVLVLSMLRAEDRARKSGADAFMMKPVERMALVAALRSLSPPIDMEGTA